MKNGIAIFIVAAILGFGTCVNAFQVGEKAEGFSLPLVNGETLELPDMATGKSMIVFFWASWCPGCEADVPLVERLYRTAQEKVTIVSINLGERQEKVMRFVRHRNISYPVALDTNKSVAQLYGVRGVPTFVGIDPEGIVVYQGYSFKALQSKMKAFIAGSPVEE